jgi:release factor glutamine methyltransferase
MIYQPAEDSYLLSNTIKNKLKSENKSISILDMGSGSGIQAQTCKDLGFKNIIAADINPEVIDHLNKKKFKTIQSNLFSKINKNLKFDLIIFNPPYLPKDKREPKDSMLNTTAGKKGYEIIIKFLEQAKSYLSKKGIILLLFSSLSQPKIIINKSNRLGYKLKLLSKEKLDFEEIYVYEFSKAISK